MTVIVLQAIAVRTGCNDKIGQLVLIDNELVALLVRLDDKMHGADEGKWFLEVALGPLEGQPTFGNLEDAKDWFSHRVY
jgi:hypothetical protein